MTDTRSSVLITVDELADRIAGEPGLVLLDISDDLETAPLERPVVPGAIAVSLASDISGPASKLMADITCTSLDAMTFPTIQRFCWLS